MIRAAKRVSRVEGGCLGVDDDSSWKHVGGSEHCDEEGGGGGESEYWGWGSECGQCGQSAGSLLYVSIIKSYLGRNHIVSTSFRTITMLCFN